MKSINMQEFLIGPLAVICVVVVFLAAVRDMSLRDIPALAMATGASR